VLYLDASALIKRYIREIGTAKIDWKLEEEEKASRPVFTSILTFAEVHTTLARRVRDRSLSSADFDKARKKFDADWTLSLTPVELAAGVLLIIRDLATQFGLKGADTVHLASASWLRDMALVGVSPSGEITFATSDGQLANAAIKKGFEVFNPEVV
jgi:uncharacterized protein